MSNTNNGSRPLAGGVLCVSPSGLVLDERISKIIVESVRLTYDFTKFLTEAIRKHKH
jgi:hypothetical protein